MFSQKEKKKNGHTHFVSRFIHGRNVFYNCVYSFPFAPSLALVRPFSLSLSLSLASFNSFVGECTDFASRDPRLIACTNVSKNKRRNCTVNGCSVFPFFFHFFFFSFFQVSFEGVGGGGNGQ